MLVLQMSEKDNAQPGVRLAGSHDILDLVAARSKYTHNAAADGLHDS